MHAVKCGWVGQTFALAKSNESGRRRSRIRRSKEERKGMVESFIKRYQKQNNGDFPSLNLTHKEVGGSFYTVREIVREIIQENRVLGPAKLSSEEPNEPGSLEEYPLGSISIEPQANMLGLNEINVTTDIQPDHSHITLKEKNFLSNGQTLAPDSLVLDDKHVDVLGDSVEKVKVSDETGWLPHEVTNVEEVSDSTGWLPHSKNQNFEIEQAVNGSVASQKYHAADEPITTYTVSCSSEGTTSTNIQPSSVSSPEGSQGLVSEHIHNGSNQRVDKIKEFGERIDADSLARENLGRANDGAIEAAATAVGISPTKIDVVVETFPLRPVSSTIQDVDGGSSKSNNFTETSEANIVQDGRLTIVDSSSDLANKKVEEKQGSTLKTSKELSDANEPQKIRPPSLESISHSPVNGASLLDVSDVRGIEADSLPTGLKAGSSSDRLVSKETTAAGARSTSHDDGSRHRGNQPTLDRINLETWEGATMKSSHPETNPLLALWKAFVTALVKLWTQ